MTENEQKKQNLSIILKQGGFDFEFTQKDNIEEPILLISNYSTNQEKNKVNFAFSLAEFYSGIDNFNFGSKYWMTEQSVKSINGNIPNPHIEYKEFEHRGERYYPFSAQLQEYSLQSTTSIKSACKELYSHINFQNE